MIPLFLEPALEALVPVVVKLVGGLLPADAPPTDKYTWVEGAVNEALLALAAKLRLPAWATALEGEAEIVIKEFIQKELAKIDPPQAPPAA